MKVAYEAKNLHKSTLAVIGWANGIIGEYEAEGFTLTLRQLFYQFVSRDLLANTERAYKRLGSIINDGRMAGLIDWSAIEDRLRMLRTQATWSDPQSIVRACAEQFRLDAWASQRYRPEVWIEKDALAGVIEPICLELRVPYFACRGYASASAVWRAGRRHREYIRDSGQVPIIFHLGDHDPSGLDMTRDNADRLEMFAEQGVQVRRLALNMAQIEQYEPPPNPTKMTDTRAAEYITRYGQESWELDALEPRVIAELIRSHVLELIDEGPWDKVMAQEKKHRRSLGHVGQNWSAAVKAAQAAGSG